MKDILIGFLIIVLCFIVIDFFYTEKNTCSKTLTGGGSIEYKCGFIKKEMNINIDLFNRYW